MTAIVILFGTSFLAIVLWHYWCVKWSRSAKLLNLLPGPPAVPLLGSTFTFLAPQEKLWKILTEELRIYFPICKFWMYSSCLVGLSDPDDIEVLLLSTRHIQKGIIYNYMRTCTLDGLVTSKGEKWHARRRMLTPTFHFNVLQQFLRTFVEEAKYTLKELKETGEPVAKGLIEFFGKYTLDVICVTAIGKSTREITETGDEYREATSTMMLNVIYRYFRPWLHYDFIFNLSPKGFQQKRTLNKVYAVINNIIQERKKYHDSTDGIYLRDLTTSDEENERDQGQQENVYKSRKERPALVDLLIAAQREGNQMDDKGILEELLTILTAGYHTTATALTFLFLRLAQHKKVQDRARDEVNKICSKNDGKLDVSVVQDMQYLERCIKETLRLHPVVAFTMRNLKEDLQLKKYVIPAETEIIISIYNVHRNPKYWPNPEVFDPDRFLPENSKGRHPFAYIPFSGGPRNCIGQKYAMMEMKILSSYLLRNFYVQPIDKIEDISMNLSVVTTPGHPVRVNFVPIN